LLVTFIICIEFHLFHFCVPL
jgi:hypothetical protein